MCNWGMVGVADFRLIANHPPGLQAFPILFSMGMTWQILLFLLDPDLYVTKLWRTELYSGKILSMILGKDF